MQLWIGKCVEIFVGPNKYVRNVFIRELRCGFAETD